MEQGEQTPQQQCIFCQIIEGRVQSKKVFEDSESIGILDINPASPGHVLILPKKHYAIMPQMNDMEIGHTFTVAKHMSGTILKTLKAEGTNIFVANGQIAGQKAPHFMIHVIPRREGDKIPLNVPENNIQAEELQKVREMLAPKIKEHLKYDIKQAGSNQSIQREEPMHSAKEKQDQPRQAASGSVQAPEKIQMQAAGNTGNNNNIFSKSPEQPVNLDMISNIVKAPFTSRPKETDENEKPREPKSVEQDTTTEPKQEELPSPEPEIKEEERRFKERESKEKESKENAARKKVRLDDINRLFSK